MAIANITNNILTDSGVSTSSLLPLTGGTLTGALSGTSATFSVNQSGATGIFITNSSTSTDASAATRFNNSGSTVSYIGLGGASRASYVNIGANILSMYTDNTAGMSFLVDAAGPISFATNSTTRLTIASTGAATFSNNLAVGGSTDDTSGGLYSNIALNGTTNSRYSLLTGGTARARFQFDGTNTSITTTSTGGKLQLATFGAAAMEFITNDTLRATITSGGNVGIGTSSPSSILEVAGTSSTSDFRISRTVSSSTYFYIKAPGGSPSASQLGVNGTDVMTLNASGNVGIGTSSPSYKLDIQNGSSFDTRLRATSLGGTVGILFETANDFSGTSQAYIKGIGAGNSGAADLIFGTGAGGGATTATERMRITSIGNVGIGTSSPATAGGGYTGLDIRGSGGGSIVLGSTSSIYSYLYAEFSGLYIQTASSTPIIFSPGGNERMRITSGGNLLIGTTTDESYKLYVNGGSGNAGLFYTTSAANQIKAAGTAPAITFTNTITSPTIGGTLGAATSANQFLTGTSAGDVVLINNYSGNRVYVVSSSGGVYLTSGATSWTANSDIRLKNINSHIENAVEKLSTLQTINFSYKDDKNNKQNLGLIAQEVEKIFPELIDKNGDDMLGVRYTELVPVLIKAIQELEARIKQLENK